MGIRLKLALLLTGLLVPLLGIGGWLNVRVLEETMLEEMRHRGQAMLSSLSVPCAIALANHEIERLDDYLAELSGKKSRHEAAADGSGDPIQDLRYLCVVNQRGRVLAHTQETTYGTLRDDPFARRAIASAFARFERFEEDEDGATLAVSLPVRSGLRWGTLIAEFSLERVLAQTAEMRTRTLIITMALIFSALIALGVGLSRLVVRPVQSLSVMAEHLGEGKLDHRVRVESGDELGKLARAFNATAEELDAYTRDLENKVRIRSREIVEKNDELQMANRRLADANERLEEVATTDGLTGLANKVHWLNRLEFEVERARRGNHKLSLLMLDVDHFKHYNDNHGHLAGDSLLADLADIIRHNLRVIDIVGRFGGEEFGMVLLDTGRRSASRAAEKIRKAVARSDFPGQDLQPEGNLTVSIGVAELKLDVDSANDLIERADQALYRAKGSGRNRVEVA